MITEIDASLLEKIADLTGKPVGAFNIRKDMGCEARQSTEHIAIDPRADGKPGIDIHFKEGTCIMGRISPTSPSRSGPDWASATASSSPPASRASPSMTCCFWRRARKSSPRTSAAST